ncbi:stage V sporulation protein B [Clostridia bacterium]|nr:stage V sporulation protein B [Clostridia bacterium]
MASNRKTESAFLVQGSILAIASMISRIIGLIYRIPLTAIFGDHGSDYYGAAMEVYSILLLISSYSLPLAVSKLVSTRMAMRERKNAFRIFKGALLFAIVTGTLAGLIVYFGAREITVYLKTPLSVFALQVLAPTLLIVAILGVIRGFFQGMGTMMPSAISQLLEQIINAVVSIWMAVMLFGYGKRIGAVLGNPDSYAQAYGAAGGTIGTGAGAMIALLFMLVVFLIYRPGFKKRIRQEQNFHGENTHTESYATVFKVLLFTIVPVLLSTTVYNISNIIDMGVFKHLAARQGYEEVTYSGMWGIFSMKYRTLVNVPIAIASALAASSVPSIATAFAESDMRMVRRKIHVAMRYIMIVSLPCAVGIGVLASPILQLLFHDGRILPARLIQAGAISIVFYSISTLSNAVLQGLNRMKVPVTHAVFSLIAHVVLLVGLMLVADLNIYAVVLANTFFSLLMCFLNGRSIKKYARYRQEIPRTFVIPAISSLFMGGGVYGVYHLLMKLTQMGGISERLLSALATGLSIVLGMVIYFFFMILLRGLSESDLRSFPLGGY